MCTRDIFRTLAYSEPKVYLESCQTSTLQLFNAFQCFSYFNEDLNHRLLAEKNYLQSLISLQIQLFLIS